MNLPHDRTALRVTPGLQGEGLTGTYRVTEEANRLGIRLEGESVTPRVASIVSEGAPLGAVQVTPSGQLIILGVEQQTAGGYPKVANVIAADLWKLGQIRPRDQVQFSTVTFEQARELFLQQETWLAQAIQYD